jgi:SAM-dependent methyltransferase
VRAIWHDLECGGYGVDIPLWHDLAARHGAPVLDVGAGTGRVTLALASAGFAVTAVDIDEELLQALRSRAGGLDVRTVTADARTLALPQSFALCVVPMQTIQLLGGREGRLAFLAGGRSLLADRGVIAVALADQLELFEVCGGEAGPLPDVCEVDGVVYSSRPTAVRLDPAGSGYILERRREVVSRSGELAVEHDHIHLDPLDAATLEAEAAVQGLRPLERIEIPATGEYVGSTVVLLGA